jgi:hypothetical protein
VLARTSRDMAPLDMVARQLRRILETETHRER